MTDKEMKLELELHDVKDNPFDVMLHHSLELTRELLYACRRMRNLDVPEQIRTNKERLEFCMNRIEGEFSKLMDMSDETVAMCRETSCYYQSKEFDKINKELLRIENNMETVWSRSVPNRDDRFEQVRLGVDSDGYKRLLELRDLVDNSEEFSSVNTSYLYGLCEVISRPDSCVKCFGMSEEELKEKQEIIKKYELSENDIEYMISYMNSKKK